MKLNKIIAWGIPLTLCAYATKYMRTTYLHPKNDLDEAASFANQEHWADLPYGSPAVTVGAPAVLEVDSVASDKIKMTGVSTTHYCYSMKNDSVLISVAIVNNPLFKDYFSLDGMISGEIATIKSDPSMSEVVYRVDSVVVNNNKGKIITGSFKENNAKHKLSLEMFHTDTTVVILSIFSIYKYSQERIDRINNSVWIDEYGLIPNGIGMTN